MDYRKLLRFPQNHEYNFHLAHAGWLAVAAMPLLLGVATAFAVAPGNASLDVQVETVTQSLALPRFEMPASSGTRYWRADTISRGDTLSGVMQRMGVSASEAMGFIKQSRVGQGLLRLPAGETLHIQTDDAGELFAVRYLKDDQNGEKNLINIRKTASGEWAVNADTIEAVAIDTPSSIRVLKSFASSAASSGLPKDVRAQLDEIFSDQIDLDSLQRGDEVNLVYQTLYYDGETIGAGRVLAAEVKRGNRTWHAYYAAHDDESGSYYDSNGQPLQKGFDARPVDNARVSSGFGYRRHPVLGGLRLHQGIDYAAPSGTPIRAAADGTVANAGTESGYGNVVRLRHNNRYETVYAHMSRFGNYRSGQTVKAGDIIGYVGSTGRSTGAHLHFEVRVGGTPVDPTVNAVPAPRLTASALSAFRKANVALDQQIDVVASAPNTTTLARLD